MLLVLRGGQKNPAAQGPEQLLLRLKTPSAKRPAGQGEPTGSLWVQKKPAAQASTVAVGQAEGVCVGRPDTEAEELALPDGDAVALWNDEAEGHPESLAEALCESDTEAHSEAAAEALGDGEAEVQMVADAEARCDAEPRGEAEGVDDVDAHGEALREAVTVALAVGETVPVEAADEVADAVTVSDVTADADADREPLLLDVPVAVGVGDKVPVEVSFAVAVAVADRDKRDPEEVAVLLAGGDAVAEEEEVPVVVADGRLDRLSEAVALALAVFVAVTCNLRPLKKEGAAEAPCRWQQAPNNVIIRRG